MKNLLRSERERDEGTAEGSERYNIADFEVEERGPRAKECRQCLEAGKAKDVVSHLELPERNQALAYLDFAQGEQIQTSDL